MTKWTLVIWLIVMTLNLHAADTPQQTKSTGAWAFNPGNDPFKQAVLDLRTLNEKEAGEHGFVKLTQDGNSFERGDGRPIRFWTVLRRIDGKGKAWDQATLDRYYRNLAKRGVNMTRLFCQLSKQKEGARLEDVDDVQLQKIFAHVAAAKKQGIYVTIAPYWSHSKVVGSWKLEGLKKGDSPYAQFFVNERFRNAYKGWMREMLTRPNPHTGTALKDEPAVVIIQVHNEDGMFWYQTQNFKEPYKRFLRLAFADWLKKKYGSLEKALARWNGEKHQEDAFGNGEVGLYIAWHLGQPAGGGKARRIADQVQFIAELQRDVYAEIDDFLKHDIGCKQLTSACNWRTVNDDILLDVERWTYAATDVIALNRYTGGIHLGKNRGWQINAGEQLVYRSVLHDPTKLPIAVKQVDGHPFILTENAWVFPNRYQAEGPFLIAAYSSLTGVDSAYWSMISSAGWANDIAFPWTKRKKNPSLKKWMVDVPQCMGLFPANALAFRRGYIAQARKPAVHEERSLDAMWQRTVPIIAEGRSFDPLRDKGDFAGQSSIKKEIDPRAFLVGPVTVKYGGTPGKSRAADLKQHIRGNTITSLTRQIMLDADKGVCTVDAPKYQGVCGFLRAAGGRFTLSDVTFESQNDYAAISVVPLDDNPLAGSEKILVQIGTIARPSGWKTVPAEVTPKMAKTPMNGVRIISTGKGPWQLENTQLTLRIRNSKLSSATRLDVNGYPAETVKVQRDGNELSITVPPNTLYLVLQD